MQREDACLRGPPAQEMPEGRRPVRSSTALVRVVSLFICFPSGLHVVAMAVVVLLFLHLWTCVCNSLQVMHHSSCFFLVPRVRSVGQEAAHGGEQCQNKDRVQEERCDWLNECPGKEKSNMFDVPALKLLNWPPRP